MGRRKNDGGLAEEEEREIASWSFRIYGHPLEMSTSVRYPGIVISTVDDDWTAVIRNLAKAWPMWRRVTSILIRERARPRVSGFFFNTVVN